MENSFIVFLTLREISMLACNTVPGTRFRQSTFSPPVRFHIFVLTIYGENKLLMWLCLAMLSEAVKRWTFLRIVFHNPKNNRFKLFLVLINVAISSEKKCKVWQRFRAKVDFEWNLNIFTCFITLFGTCFFCSNFSLNFLSTTSSVRLLKIPATLNHRGILNKLFYERLLTHQITPQPLIKFQFFAPDHCFWKKQTFRLTKTVCWSYERK